MNFSKVLFIALIGLFTFSSCGDDDGDSLDITGDAWSLTSLRTDIDGDGTLEESAEDCDKDDLITFSDDGTWNSDEGATKCDPADPQTSTGTWELSSDNSTFTITEGGLTTQSEVISISNNRIELRDEIDFLGYLIITETVLTR